MTASYTISVSVVSAAADCSSVSTYNCTSSVE